jgi:hypothetical protein
MYRSHVNIIKAGRARYHTSELCVVGEGVCRYVCVCVCRR